MAHAAPWCVGNSVYLAQQKQDQSTVFGAGWDGVHVPAFLALVSSISIGSVFSLTIQNTGLFRLSSSIYLLCSTTPTTQLPSLENRSQHGTLCRRGVCNVYVRTHFGTSFRKTCNLNVGHFVDSYLGRRPTPSSISFPPRTYHHLVIKTCFT